MHLRNLTEKHEMNIARKLCSSKFNTKSRNSFNCVTDLDDRFATQTKNLNISCIDKHLQYKEQSIQREKLRTHYSRLSSLPLKSTLNTARIVL